MATTRSKRKALGAAAPDFDQLQNRPDSAAARTRRYKTVTIEDVPDEQAGFQREGSAGLDIPGSFAASPVYDGWHDDPDSDDARAADAHISTLVESCTDVESCHSRESTGGQHKPCPQPERTSTSLYPGERIVEPGHEPSTYPKTWSELETATSTPFVGFERSTTPFRTPSRKSKARVGVDKTPGLKLQRAKYFPHDVLDTEIHVNAAQPEQEPEQRSDETLKLTAKPRRMKSEAQQREEDMAYLRAVIKDNKRRRRLQEMLPDVIPNNKSLLEEMREALRESSGGEGYESSIWEDDIYEIQSVDGNGEEKRPEPSPQAGPSYFDKGKWVRGSDYEANQQYKASRLAEAKDTMSEDEGREKKSKRKRARPSLGIRIDDVQPNRTQQPKPNITLTVDDLKASLAALPAGGYFAEKMRAKSLGPDRSRITAGKTPGGNPSNSSSSSSTLSSSSEEDSSGSESAGTSSSSDSSDGMDGLYWRTISEKHLSQLPV